MQPTNPAALAKRKPATKPVVWWKCQSSNITKRIERAMRIVGVPTTEARTRYARLVGCVRSMRGSAQRWQAGWALYNIMRDWVECLNPGGEPTQYFQSTIEMVENELVELCHENVE